MCAGKPGSNQCKAGPSCLLAIWSPESAQRSPDSLQCICSERRLVLSYFAANDSISIFEPPVPNTGVPGGKYLERSYVNKPKSSDRYTDKCAPCCCPAVLLQPAVVGASQLSLLWSCQCEPALPCPAG